MPAGIHLFKVNIEKLEQGVKKKNFKVNNKDTRTTKLVSFWCLVNFERISDLVLVFFFVTLNM